MDKQYKIVIAKIGEGVARLRAAKVLRTLKSISLSEALDLIDSAPCTVYEGPKAEADRVAKELSQAGANINIDEIVAEPEPRSETKCKIHNKEAVDTCMNCGQPACEICLAEEGNNWYCSKCFAQKVGKKEIISKCPSCGRSLGEDDVVCISCGYDFSTRQKVRVETNKPPVVSAHLERHGVAPCSKKTSRSNSRHSRQLGKQVLCLFLGFISARFAKPIIDSIESKIVGSIVAIAAIYICYRIWCSILIKKGQG